MPWGAPGTLPGRAPGSPGIPGRSRTVQNGRKGCPDALKTPFLRDLFGQSCARDSRCDDRSILRRSGEVRASISFAMGDTDCMLALFRRASWATPKTTENQAKMTPEQPLERAKSRPDGQVQPEKRTQSARGPLRALHGPSATQKCATQQNSAVQRGACAPAPPRRPLYEYTRGYIYILLDSMYAVHILLMYSI